MQVGVYHTHRRKSSLHGFNFGLSVGCQPGLSVQYQHSRKRSMHMIQSSMEVEAIANNKGGHKFHVFVMGKFTSRNKPHQTEFIGSAQIVKFKCSRVF